MRKKKAVPYFEITDGGDLVRVEVLGITDSPSIDHRDQQWLDTVITVKGSVFRGQYSAEFMPVDFYKFRQQWVSLIYNLDHTALFEGTEGYLSIQFNMKTDGYIEVDIKACDVPEIGGHLSFKMAMEESNIKHLVDQLDSIVEHYPIT